ncbi:hypothetical protein GCM10022207_91940 [Streptomyces lannensis]|uniref:Uncharacterized protein n=1 Tax=Streptomyces lannensis TaxID=766498 RepID=A0ABP7LWZ9_9ACTN
MQPRSGTPAEEDPSAVFEHMRGLSAAEQAPIPVPEKVPGLRDSVPNRTGRRNIAEIRGPPPSVTR